MRDAVEPPDDDEDDALEAAPSRGSGASEPLPGFQDMVGESEVMAAHPWGLIIWPHMPYIAFDDGSRDPDAPRESHRRAR